MSYPTYYDPAQPRGPPPPHHYYQHPPAGYPPASANGYPQPPQSPTQGHPPMRSHTAFPGSSQYAPPPSSGYYGALPPQGGPPPPGAPSGYPGHPGQSGAPAPAPAAAAPPPAPPAPANGSQPPASSAAPPAPSAPAGGAPPPGGFEDLPLESLQTLINRLESLKTKAEPPPPSGQAPPTPVTVGAGVSPHTHHAMPPPAAPPGGPHSRHGGPPPGHGYPPYGYGRPPSPEDDRSPPPPAPARPPPGYPASVPGKGGPVPMPGSFYPEAPAPPPSAGGKPGPPPPGGRPEPSRKVSEQTSEFSYTSASTQSGQQSIQALMHPWGGTLVQVAPGHEPKPKPKLQALFRGIAQYMIMDIEPKDSVVVTVEKLLHFYQTFNMGNEEETKWKAFFSYRSYAQLSAMLCALNVDHHLVPPSPGETPAIPGLTPRGFETWMFTQLMTAPDREARRLQKIIDRWPIFDFRAREFMPKVLPRECFPPTKDPKIHAGWWSTVSEEFPQDVDPESEEEKVPLQLPEPLPKRRRNYSLRGGKHPQDTEDSEAAPPTPAAEAPPAVPSKKPSRPYGGPAGVDPRDFLTQEEKDASPPTERYRQPYGSATGNPSWREEVNPRPTLGEEPVPRPPTRSRSTRAPKSGHGATSSRSKPKRGRSVRPSRRERGDSPERRYNSDEDDDDDVHGGRYEGYGRRYEADGLYDDTSPPRATTPHHSGGGARDHYRSAREPSRPPGPRGAPAPPPPEKGDIREYTYQDQYDRDYARRHGGGSHHGHGNRRSGHYGRYPPGS